MVKKIKKKTKTIDPWTKKEVVEEKKEKSKETDLTEYEDQNKLGISYLEKLQLNLLFSLGSPWKVKHNLIERSIGVLNMIEIDLKKLHDPKWIQIYERFSRNIHNELEKLDDVWQDLNTKSASKDQLKAFQNIEIFMKFLSTLDEVLKEGLYSDDLIRMFIEFLKEEGLFLE